MILRPVRPVGAADDELAGGVDVEDEVALEEGGVLGLQTGDEAGEEYVAHVGLDALAVHVFVVLCGEDYGVDALRDVVVAVFDGELALGVGPEVGHRGILFASDGGEFLESTVSLLA